MYESLIGEFELDWQLAGKAERTAKHYAAYLRAFTSNCGAATLEAARKWLSQCKSVAVRRKCAQAIRAFGCWAESHGYEVMPWWKAIAVPKELSRPQRTVTEADYEAAVKRSKSARDRALIEVLWSTGLRRSELARLALSDVNFEAGYVVVRQAKNGRPRVVPLAPLARHALRRLMRKQVGGTVFGMSSNAIRQRLRRLGLPSAHAWRRGWAVQALRSGVSEASVRAAAGWSSGAMVVRYTAGLAEELAISEFKRSWTFETRAKRRGAHDPVQG